jgi:hypothetical protein
MPSSSGRVSPIGDGVGPGTQSMVQTCLVVEAVVRVCQAEEVEARSQVEEGNSPFSNQVGGLRLEKTSPTMVIGCVVRADDNARA